MPTTFRAVLERATVGGASVGGLLARPPEEPARPGRPLSPAEPATRAGEREPWRDFCIGRRTRRAVVAVGPIGIIVATVAGAAARGPYAYPAAWAGAGALFVVPATVLAVLVWRRCSASDRPFWSCWLAGLVGSCLFGACLLVQPVDPVVLRGVSTGLLGVVCLLWGAGTIGLVSRTDGARILAIDALEIALADLAVVAPVAVLAGGRLVDARALWFAGPAAAAAAGLPLSCALTLTLCVRLPSRQRRPELIGTVAAVVGEVNAGLQVAQGVTGFRLPAAPLLAVQGLTMWLLLLLVAHATRSFPEGLARLSPDAQVRRWSPLPVLVVASVAALAGEAATAPASRPWVVPTVVAVLGASAVLMTVRHLLVVSETRRLYRQLAAEAERRHRLLDELVRAVEDDRHRMVGQLHELSVEWMAAIGALLRTCRTAGSEGAEVVVGALDRMYGDVGLRVESLRRLRSAVRPPTVTGEGLRAAVAASTATIFGPATAPTVDVQVAEGIELDWTTSTIVHRLVLESLRSACNRWPVSTVAVTVDAHGDGGALRVTVTDDAVGRDPLAGPDEPWLSTLRLFAGLGGGTVEVNRRAGGGAEVCAVLRRRP